MYINNKHRGVGKMTEKDKKDQYLFENDLKQRFLETLNPNTAITYGRVLFGIQNVEVQYNEGISKFDETQLKEALSALKGNNINTLATYMSSLSKYLEFLKSKGYIETNILKKFNIKDLESLVHGEVYLTEKKLRRIEDQLANYQDSVILRLIFEGVSGKGYSELLNLRRTDVDYKNNILHLRNTVKEDTYISRELEVSDRALELIRGAVEQELYYRNNGEYGVTKLFATDYVLKASQTTHESVGSKLGTNVLYRRIKMIGETYSLEQFKAKLVQRSGMLNYASQVIDDINNITVNDLKKIAVRFNIRNFDNLRGFITKENIEKIQYQKKAYTKS